MSKTPRSDAEIKKIPLKGVFGVARLCEELEIELEQARAEIERLRMALEALYSWVKAEADHFGANAPDDDMIVMVSSAIKAAKGGV